MSGRAPVPETIWIALATLSGHGWFWEVSYLDKRHEPIGGCTPTLGEAMRAVSEAIQNGREVG